MYCSTFRTWIYYLGIVLLGLLVYNNCSQQKKAKRKRTMARSAEFSGELSELFSKLWELDVNRCKPGVDYELDLQSYVTGTNMSRPDRSDRTFFKSFDEQKVFSKPTYNAFRQLLDNYESSTTMAEQVTEQEERENWSFLALVCQTSVMTEAHRFLASRNKVSGDLRAFQQQLYDIWFKIYKRTREDGAANSCGFEHVFVGESRQHEVIGFHNWLQFYLQEKAGNIDYRGYFRRGTTEEFEKSPRLVTLQFTWQKSSGKPIGSLFVGPSPEFEMAVYSIMFLLGKEKALVRIKQYDVELTCYRHGRGIGSAYPVSKSD